MNKSNLCTTIRNSAISLITLISFATHACIPVSCVIFRPLKKKKKKEYHEQSVYSLDLPELLWLSEGYESVLSDLGRTIVYYMSSLLIWSRKNDNQNQKIIPQNTITHKYAFMGSAMFLSTDWPQAMTQRPVFISSRCLISLAILADLVVSGMQRNICPQQLQPSLTGTIFSSFNSTTYRRSWPSLRIKHSLRSHLLLLLEEIIVGSQSSALILCRVFKKTVNFLCPDRAS